MKKILERIKLIDVFSDKIFKALSSIAICCVIVISIAQVGLKDDTLRRYFTNMDEYEGAHFEVMAELPEEEIQTVTLEALGDNFEGAELLLNGKKHSNLVSGKNIVKISDTTVIEIYSPGGKIDVKICDMSNNIILYTKDTNAVADRQIAFVGRVGIKQ